jgi:3-oxoacyl-[acyl-carrier-protein] synthase-3
MGSDQTRNVRISGMGSYLPARVLTSLELDQKLNLPEGSVEKLSGVATRHVVDTTETCSVMAARACKAALISANMKISDVDAIIFASHSYEQPLPCEAALVQRELMKELGPSAEKIPCFDINSTCLSFVTALDTLSWAIAGGAYKTILIVSSEIASVGLNWNSLESSSIFGDGAVAAVVSRSDGGQSSKIISSRMETYSRGWAVCQIEAGGTKIPPMLYRADEAPERYLFKMDGPQAFKITADLMPGMLDRFLSETGLGLSDFKMIVPHQASGHALTLMRRRLQIDKDRWMMTFAQTGNMIAASIPYALHEAIKQNKIKRGDRVLLMGTSAGFSMGLLALEY